MGLKDDVLMFHSRKAVERRKWGEEVWQHHGQVDKEVGSSGGMRWASLFRGLDQKGGSPKTLEWTSQEDRPRDVGVYSMGEQSLKG